MSRDFHSFSFYIPLCFLFSVDIFSIISIGLPLIQGTGGTEMRERDRDRNLHKSHLRKTFLINFYLVKTSVTRKNEIMSLASFANFVSMPFFPNPFS